MWPTGGKGEDRQTDRQTSFDSIVGIKQTHRAVKIMFYVVSKPENDVYTTAKGILHYDAIRAFLLQFMTAYAPRSAWATACTNKQVVWLRTIAESVQYPGPPTAW